MKISLSWLNDYVDVKEFFGKPDELAKALIGAGLEVEAIENAAIKFQHVVVGHIVELGRHPNADKLTLCQVNVGEKNLRQIVCGAKNHKQGDKVVAALPGAVLPGDFAIKVSKIRDVESCGMLCSESELGLKDESEGIVILPADAKVGTPYAEYAGLDDVVFEINVTPNRADCLSHIGLAREISCLLDRTLKLPAVKIKANPKVKNPISVKLKDKELCPRYCGRTISGVKIGPSPVWLKQRLTAVGINSINNVVDVTNYVMLEYGQPLHAFDSKTLRGEEIIIEKSKAKEKFKTFDGTEVILQGDELTIRDAEKAVALAGVIGGPHSGVSDTTTEIFLESAHFNPKGVRRTSRRYGIDTDSAYRFSRGTDVEGTEDVMNRAASLISELAGGEISKDFVDEYPTPLKRKPIKVHKKTLSERLGYSAELSDFSKWMKRLHCQVKTAGDTVSVEAPSFRVDIEMEMDLVEEYARLNGYDKIPETFPALADAPTEHSLVYTQENHLTDLLVGQGFFEARNYSFLNPKWQSLFVDSKIFAALGLATGGEAVPVKNPLSEETGVMRQSLIPGLLTNLLHNYNYGVQCGRLFEIGFIFGKQTDYVENHRVALVAWGHNYNLWEKSTQPVVLDLKSCLEGVFRRLRGQPQWRPLDTAQAPSFVHPGQSSVLFYEGKNIGFIGTLHPLFKDSNKIRSDVAVAELDVGALLRGQPRLPKVTRISKYPAVERDLALVMPLTLAVGDVMKEIEKAGAPLVQSVNVFDIFKGQGIPEGHHSVAFRYLLQDMEATLSDEKLQTVSNQILQALEKKFGIKPRS